MDLARRRVEEAHRLAGLDTPAGRRALTIGTLLAVDAGDTRWDDADDEACVAAEAGPAYTAKQCEENPDLMFLDEGFRTHLFRDLGLHLDDGERQLFSLQEFEGGVADADDVYKHLLVADVNVVRALKSHDHHHREGNLFKAFVVHRGTASRPAMFVHTSAGWRIFFCTPDTRSLSELYRRYIFYAHVRRNFERGAEEVTDQLAAQFQKLEKE